MFPTTLRCTGAVQMAAVFSVAISVDGTLAATVAEDFTGRVRHARGYVSMHRVDHVATCSLALTVSVPCLALPA